MKVPIEKKYSSFTHSTIELGKQGEELAIDYLKRQGYYIMGKNFHCHLGEIDIIAIDTISQNELVFFEVKTRNQELYGKPAEAVNITKIQHLYRVAEFFLMIHNLEHCYIRFDVIEIVKEPPEWFQIHHIKNAIPERNPYGYPF